jgi:hypothetical protein
MQCKVCGCTEDNPCIMEGGLCSWVMPGVCSACVIELKPGEHSRTDFKGSLLIEKVCRLCAHLAPSAASERMGYKNYWRCTEGRFDFTLPNGDVLPGCWAWRTICKPGKAVFKVQRRCPKFEVHPKWLRKEAP